MTVRFWGAAREVMMVSRTEMVPAICPSQSTVRLTVVRETTILSVEMRRWRDGEIRRLR